MLFVGRAACCVRDPTILHGTSRAKIAERQYRNSSQTRTHLRGRGRVQSGCALLVDARRVLGDRALVYALSRRDDDDRLRVQHVDAQFRDLPRHEPAAHRGFRAPERRDDRSGRLVSLRDRGWVHPPHSLHEGFSEPAASELPRGGRGAGPIGDARQAARHGAQQHVAWTGDGRRQRPSHRSEPSDPQPLRLARRGSAGRRGFASDPS